MAGTSTAPYNPRLIVQGHGDLVVLVPGLNGMGEVFHRQIPRLASAYRVATYTLRDDAQSMEALVDDLTRLIDHLAPQDQRAILIGESFGGALALSLALARPDHVRALVMVNSFCCYGAPVRVSVATQLLRVVPWTAMAWLRRRAKSRVHSPSTPADEVQRFIAITDRTTRAGYVNRMRILARFDARPHLSEVSMPVLLVASDADDLVPALSQAKLMAAHIPQATVRVLHGHGHICLIAPGIDLREILSSWSVDRLT